MSNNKRTNQRFSTGSAPKRSRIEFLNGPASNTRSKSQEKLATENKENIHNKVASTKKTDIYQIPTSKTIVPRTLSDYKKPLSDKYFPCRNNSSENNIASNSKYKLNNNEQRIPLNDLSVNISKASNNQNNIVKSVQSSSTTSQTKQKTIVEKENIIIDSRLVTFRDPNLNKFKKEDTDEQWKNFKTFSNENLHENILIKQNELFKTQHKGITFRESIEKSSKNENDDEKNFCEFKTFSNEDLTSAGTSKQVVRYTESLQKKIVLLHSTSPFKERVSDSNLVIHDGIPSLKKKTLKRELIKPSGIKGVIDLDPSCNTVHPTILYAKCLNDIMVNFLLKEKKYTLPNEFMKKIANLIRPRAMLINWLLKIQQYYKSDSGVFFVSIRLFDYLFNITKISKDQVQLIGIVTYWIAMKYNDIVNIPKAKDLVILCRDEITVKQIVNTERKILRFLKFDITIDEPMVCVRYYIYKMQLEECDEVALCANYLLECFILNSSSGTYLLSIQAAAAVYLSMRLLEYNIQFWDRLKKHPGYYDPVDLIRLQAKIFNMLQIIQDPDYEFREPYLKYTNKKYGAVSLKLLKKQVAT